MSRFAFGIAALAFIAFVPPATAQDQPVRVRGTVERVEEPLYIIKARNGSELKVKLADNAMVVALVKSSLADVKQGSYIGVSGLPSRMARKNASKSTFFQKPCAAPATDIAPGTCSRRAP